MAGTEWHVSRLTWSPRPSQHQRAKDIILDGSASWEKLVAHVLFSCPYLFFLYTEIQVEKLQIANSFCRSFRGWPQTGAACLGWRPVGTAALSAASPGAVQTNTEPKSSPTCSCGYSAVVSCRNCRVCTCDPGQADLQCPADKPEPLHQHFLTGDTVQIRFPVVRSEPATLIIHCSLLLTGRWQFDLLIGKYWRMGSSA